jgi:hypothetical protein
MATTLFWLTAVLVLVWVLGVVLVVRSNGLAVVMSALAIRSSAIAFVLLFAMSLLLNILAWWVVFPSWPKIATLCDDVIKTSPTSTIAHECTELHDSLMPFVTSQHP